MITQPAFRRRPERREPWRTSTGADVSEPFDELTARFLPDPQLREGTGFGSSRGLRIGGKIFAIFGDGELTVKLPRARVDELVDAGVGTRFDPGHGRLMREWLR